MSQRFRVACFDPKTGKSEELVLVASDEAAVLELVQQSGMIAMSVIREGGGPPPPPPTQPAQLKAVPIAPPAPPPPPVPQAKAPAQPKPVAPPPVARHGAGSPDTTPVSKAVPVQAVPVVPVPVQAIPVQAIPVVPIPVQAIPVQEHAAQTVSFQAVPVQPIPVQAIPVQAIAVQAVPAQALPATKASSPNEFETAMRIAPPISHQTDSATAGAARKRKRFKRRISFGPEGEIVINVVPMLDMTFQLLFFFIITFQPPEGIEAQIPLTLPPPEGKQEAAMEKKEKPDNDLVPTIDSDVIVEIKSLNNPQYPGEMGEVEVSGLTKESIRPSPGKSLDEGKSEILQKLGSVMTQLATDLKKDNMSVRLRCDPGVKWERVVQVADVCRKAKFLGIRFEKPGGS